MNQRSSPIKTKKSGGYREAYGVRKTSFAFLATWDLKIRNSYKRAVDTVRPLIQAGTAWLPRLALQALQDGMPST